MDWAYMACVILTSRGRLNSPISFSSIGIITHDIININKWIGLKQWIKTHDPYYLSYTHDKRLLQQEPIFTQNDNKTRGTSSHIRLMIQAHKSLGETLGVIVWRAKRYLSLCKIFMISFIPSCRLPQSDYICLYQLLEQSINYSSCWPRLCHNSVRPWPNL